MGLTSNAQRTNIHRAWQRLGGVKLRSRGGSFFARLQLALCLLGTTASALAAEEFRTPPVSVARVDWRAALDQLHVEVGAHPSVAPNFTFVHRYRLAASHPRALPALGQLNRPTSPIFTGISRIPVPVLLPFDPAAYLEANWTGTADNISLAHFQADFRPADVFYAGPAG